MAEVPQLVRGHPGLCSLSFPRPPHPYPPPDHFPQQPRQRLQAGGLGMRRWVQEGGTLGYQTRGGLGWPQILRGATGQGGSPTPWGAAHGGPFCERGNAFVRNQYVPHISHSYPISVIVAIHPHNWLLNVVKLPPRKAQPYLVKRKAHLAIKEKEHRQRACEREGGALMARGDRSARGPSIVCGLQSVGAHGDTGLQPHKQGLMAMKKETI